MDICNLEFNRDIFINECKTASLSPKIISWEKFKWGSEILFYKLNLNNERGKDKKLLNKEFIDLAKAIIWHECLENSLKAKNYLVSLRLIESSLLNYYEEANICLLTYKILEHAQKLAFDKYCNNNAKKRCRNIHKIVQVLVSKKIVSANLRLWDCEFKGYEDFLLPSECGHKLPNQNVIFFLSELFSKPLENQRDIFTTSIFALLMSAPWRISEVINLTNDCEVIQKSMDGVPRYGLRYIGAKGYGEDVKWIPSVMQPVVKEALKRLRTLSFDARLLANILEEIDESRKNGKVVFNGKLIEKIKGIYTEENNISIATIKDVHDIVAIIEDNKPKDFPFVNGNKKLKYSNMLCLLNKNQMHATNKLSKYEIYMPTRKFFSMDLYYNENGNQNMRWKNIFQRNGIAEQRKYFLRSHQIRHLINTLAQRGGLSDVEVAKWSGRTKVIQNRVYDHMTDDELFDIAVDFIQDTQSEYSDTKENILDNAPSLKDIIKEIRGGFD
ncbi:hypothetical protein [Photorhabdus heterorhabditis]|uniref:hypothetical protein n=1 Tax=Photorhabdus heterorhabditis TaxID=880156 RepID=UPI001BD2BA5D|nr:hypothetical protein [Photorhabdus heterorhabditis]MBS9444266.1 hypothetical protein [Photorhabdus heterorhabditis]